MNLRAHINSGLDRWRTFWFRPEPAYTLGLVRIAFGILVFLWSLELGQDLYDRFGSQGFLPQSPSRQFLFTIFEIYQSNNALLIGWFVLIISSLALIVGWHSRLAAVVVFVLILSFERRNPWIFNGGDALIRMESLFMVLAPCGAALSMDQRRRTGSFFSAQDKQLWVLRLMQVQVSVIYLSTVVAKLRGDTWQDGTAVSYALRLKDMLLLPTPSWLATTPVLAQALTWGTLLTELAIGLLVWNKRWRLPVLLAGVVLHLSIMLTIAIGFFSFAMYVLYLAFVPADRAKAIAERAQSLLTLRRRPVGLITDAEHIESSDDVPPAVEVAPRHRAEQPTVRTAVPDITEDDEPSGRHARRTVRTT
jgi:hypothetical protein